MKQTTPLLRRFLPALVLVAALVCAFLLVTRVISVKVDTEALTVARNSLRRAAVECYALEGAYPMSVDHLTERYGVSIDPSRFLVHYEFIASNLMPDITVLPMEGGGL